jgi:hypothetical protein
MYIQISISKYKHRGDGLISANVHKIASGLVEGIAGQVCR